MYLASLRKGSGLQVSPSFCPQREKSFSLQFLRFKGRILVTNNQNRLLLPKTCSIHALSSLLLHLLQEAKIRKTKSNKQTNWICRWYEVMQTENCFVVWKNITRSIVPEQITASASGMRGYLLRITEVYWQKKKRIENKTFPHYHQIRLWDWVCMFITWLDVAWKNIGKKASTAPSGRSELKHYPKPMKDKCILKCVFRLITRAFKNHNNYKPWIFLLQITCS